jgi:hypothetical protein
MAKRRELFSHKTIAYSFDRYDLQGWIFFQIIAKLGYIHIQVAAVKE